jgi:hypothetical protein
VTTIQVKDQVDPRWNTIDDAMRLSAQIREILERGGDVLVDFTGVERLNPSFLGLAIGGLYEFFSAEDLEVRLRCTGLDPLDERDLPFLKWKAARMFAAPPEVREAYVRNHLRRLEEEGWCD